jgi:hypothetical protein
VEGVMSKDLLATQFENLIKKYDSSKELSEKDYRRISKLFSSIVRTSPEVRDLFFEQVMEFLVKMRLSFNQLDSSHNDEKIKSKKKINN